MVGPRVRGEPGYGDWCIHLFAMGLCSCDGCGGHLVDNMCISCSCRYGIHEPSRFHRQRFAAWTPVAEAGRCSRADAVRAEERRERERQARKRWSAEELGDRGRSAASGTLHRPSCQPALSRLLPFRRLMRPPPRIRPRARESLPV